MRAARIGAIGALAIGLIGGSAIAPTASTAVGADADHDSGVECDASPNAGRGLLCVHGEDPPPDGAAVDERRTVSELAADTGTSVEVASATTTSCVDSGTDGKRVQALYVVAADQVNRSAQVTPLIRQWAAVTETSFVDSAAQTGGVRRVRWVHDANCTLDVDTVVVPANADDNFSATISAVQSVGYTSANRKYLLWVDANVYCGIAQLYTHSAATNNYNDGAYAMYARVDNGCWGYSSPSVEAHELMHTLGAVQSNSPHHSPYGHCLDDKDTMCYADGPGVTVSSVCPGPENERLFDCNKDDYFSTAPTNGSYLATYWNTANSGFLFDGPASPNPDPDPDPGAPVVTVTQRWTGQLSNSSPTAVRSATPGASGPVTVRLQYTGTRSPRLRVWSDGVLVADVRPVGGSIVLQTDGYAGEKVKVALSGPDGMRWILRLTYNDLAT